MRATVNGLFTLELVIALFLAPKRMEEVYP
jgi:hypothetical protein